MSGLKTLAGRKMGPGKPYVAPPSIVTEKAASLQVGDAPGVGDSYFKEGGRGVSESKTEEREV